MASRVKRSAGVLMLVLVAVLLGASPATAKIYRGTVDQEIFAPPRPTTDFAFQVKGRRARIKNLGLALECTPNDQKDPRTLVSIATPFRRTHLVLRNVTYSFKGTVQSSIGPISFETTIGLNAGKVIGVIVAKWGDCYDQDVDMKAH